MHELQIRAREFYEKAFERHMSLDYTLKVRGVVNEWARHLSVTVSSRLVLLPPPTNFERNRIHDGYRTSQNYQGASAPLIIPV